MTGRGKRHGSMRNIELCWSLGRPRNSRGRNLDGDSSLRKEN